MLLGAGLEAASLPMPDLSGAAKRRLPALQGAWVEFLDRWDWAWFCTLTFREAPHPEKADKVFRVWISKMNRELYGSRWYKHGDGLRWVRPTEYQERGAIHYHPLVGGPDMEKLRRLSWMDEWEDLAGWARIEPPAHGAAVREYVCKVYSVKQGEIDLGGPMAKEEAPPFTLPLLVALPLTWRGGGAIPRRETRSDAEGVPGADGQRARVRPYVERRTGFAIVPNAGASLSLAEGEHP